MTTVQTSVPEAFDTSKKSEYNRSYYYSKRDELLARKRERYLNDPEYREKLKSDASRRRRENRTGPTMSFAGKTVPVFRATGLAEELGKCLSTINFWQKHGTIPETPFRSEGGYRLYTAEMIDGIRSALVAIPRPERGDKGFYELVKESWMAAGVPILNG